MSLIERAVARLSRRSDAPGLARDSATGVPALLDAALPHAKSIEGSNGVGPGGHHPKAEVAHKLGSPVELHLESLRERGYATPSARATATGQEFRTIKSLILEKAFGTANQKGEDSRRIIVTSSMPGEGKTFCAINLAMSVAATGDRPVLLIDADVARPAIAREMGIKETEGLIDFLTGKQSDPFRLVLPTNIPALKVVSAGTAESHSGELLAGTAMAAFLDRICAGFPDHLVIIDTPPLLAVTETRSVVKRGGQILMVVAAGDTPRKSVDAALAAMPAGCDVSLILNKSPHPAEGHDYYYGY